MASPPIPRPASINVSDDQWNDAVQTAFDQATSESITLTEDGLIRDAFKDLIITGVLPPPQGTTQVSPDALELLTPSLIAELPGARTSTEGGKSRVVKSLRVTAKEWRKQFQAEIDAANTEANTRAFFQGVVRRLNTIGAKKINIEGSILDAEVPKSPLELKMWLSTITRNLDNPDPHPSLNIFDTPSQLSNLVTDTPANELVTERLIRKRKLREEEKARKKEEQAEADRQALELLRKQKESELLEYKTAYFASPQVGIYIGDQWVGNAVTLEFTENVAKAPLYGYASTHFDAVAKGNVIVQGQLSIAYTGENYLASILSKYSTGEGAGDSVPLVVKDPIERAKKLFWALENINEPVITRPLEYGYLETKTGQVASGFNIRVFYGSQKLLIESFEGSSDLKFDGPIQTLRNVHLTSRSIILQPTGDPIGETYTFFARSVTTGVRRQSINPSKTTVNRDGQVNIATLSTSDGEVTGLKFEPQIGP